MKTYRDLKYENHLLREIIANFPEYIPYCEYGDLVEICPYCGECDFNGHDEKCIRQIIPSRHNYKEISISCIGEKNSLELKLLKD